MWNESLESQLRWKFYNDLMDIVRPSMQDFRDLTVVVETPEERKRRLSDHWSEV